MDILKIAIALAFLSVCGIIFLFIRELGRYAEDVSSRNEKDDENDEGGE